LIKKILTKTKYTYKDFKNELFKRDIDFDLLKKIKEESGIDLNKADDKGRYLLHECIEKSMLKSALWLIEEGADVTISNSYGENALDIAIDYNKLQVVRFILALGKIELEKRDKDGRTLLQNVVMQGQNDVAKILIDYGADVNHKDNRNRNVIFDALAFGNEDFINYLLEINGIELNNIDLDQNSVMNHHEVINNDNIARKLIEKGADTTIKDKNGNTYLCRSALKGIEAYDIVAFALEHGADINSRVLNENTILMELISSYSKIPEEEKKRREDLFKMAKQVVMQGIDLNAIDINGDSALFKAVRSKDTELVSFLLNSRIDPNIQNNYMQSALHFAVYQGIESLDIILLLIRYGADPLVKNNKFQTIYEILNNIILHTHGRKKLQDKFILSKIRQDGQYIVILKELLESNTKNLNFLDSNGDPLFFTPLLYEHFQLFKLYIKYGLDIHNKNSKGNNVLFEYILKVFNDNKENKEFQNNISMILSKKVEHNTQDNEGKTILHKVLETPCNLHLFDTLTEIILFDYTLTDKLGRSVIHSTIWHDKTNVIKRIHEKNSKIVNIPDCYGILPMTYAALLGNQALVLLFIELNANVTSGIEVSQNAKEKFRPMLKNLDKLRLNIKNPDTLKNIEKVIDQVKRDFA
jgi:ankyrin repeat protein